MLVTLVLISDIFDNLLIISKCSSALELNEEFIALFKKTWKAISDINPAVIAEYLAVHLQVLLSPLPNEVSEDLQKSISSLTSLQAVLNVFTPFVSWYNYAIMQDMACIFLSSDIHLLVLWRAYREKIKDYSMVELGQCGEVIYGSKGEGMMSLTATLHPVYQSHPLHLIHHIWATISNALGHPHCPCVYQCNNPEKSEVVFMVPTLVYNIVFPLNESQRQLLETAGLLKIECGEYKYQLTDYKVMSYNSS